MAFNAIHDIPEEFIEERLFTALVTGPLENSDGLLDALEDVNYRMSRRRTFLHVSVSLGKVDWVEELLARGADPDLKDGSQSTAMSSAEEMLIRFPDDNDRRQVLRLVTLVHRRDQAIRRQLETSSVESAVFSTPANNTDNISAMADLSSSVDLLKEEMWSLGADLRSSLEELKGQVRGRDALLRSSEAAMTSSAGELTSLSGRLQAETAATGTTSGTLLPLLNVDDTQHECVDAMLLRTEVVYGGGRGVALVRRLYKRLYDIDNATASILKYLCRESRFKAKVDRGCQDIRRLKGMVVNFDGIEQSGIGWRSFADLTTDVVYLGAKVFEGWTEERVAGWFAEALAQMSLHLAYNNRGKPYERGDGVHELEFKRAFVEADGRRKSGFGLDGWIHDALSWSTQSAKEVHLAAVVPYVIARYGSSEGTRILREKVPLLFDYFKERVVVSLLAKARE